MQIIQIIQIIQIRNISALKHPDHELGIDHTDHLSEMWIFFVDLFMFCLPPAHAVDDSLHPLASVRRERATLSYCRYIEHI